MALIYASPNEEGLCYRFVDKGFDPDDFLEVRSDGSLVPISCRDLGRHFAKRRINCSNQITSCHDYRTVIQNLPHKKGQELRDYIARYSFCHGSTGRRLKDIEKIVSGMLMRSTDFADLREMLVNCIDENRDSIALDVQPGSRYFCDSLFWASQPKQAAKITRPLMPAAPQPSCGPRLNPARG